MTNAKQLNVARLDVISTAQGIPLVSKILSNNLNNSQVTSLLRVFHQLSKELGSGDVKRVCFGGPPTYISIGKPSFKAVASHDSSKDLTLIAYKSIQCTAGIWIYGSVPNFESVREEIEEMVKDFERKHDEEIKEGLNEFKGLVDWDGEKNLSLLPRFTLFNPFQFIKSM